MKYLCIDVGGTYTKYAVMDEECNFYLKDKVPTVYDTLEHFVEMLEEIYRKNLKFCREQAELCIDETETLGNDKGNLAGIALSSAGVIDSETGFMYNGGSLTCISNINIVEILEKRCGVPVTVENDAKCAALAELWRGSLAGCRNAAAVICGTAVGGAVICNGEVVRGKRFMAGEFSYLLTESSDPMNPEWTFAQTGGVPGLIRMVAEKKQIPGEELDGEKVFSMANCGDEEAIGCIRRYACRIAMQINNCQYIFDPDRIAVGGGISAQPLFIQMIKEELIKLNGIYPYVMPIPEVVACQFFNDSNLIGALYVHLKSREEKISIEKVEELMGLVRDRREGRYLREMLMGR